MELVELIKKIALNAVESTKPVAVYTATVVSKQPFTVQINPKMILSNQLIVTKTIKDMIDGNTLTIGDTVLIQRVQGGQKFVTIDKVV